MKNPLSRFDGVPEKITSSAEKVVETVNSSMTALLIVGLVAAAALVIGLLALKK